MTYSLWSTSTIDPRMIRLMYGVTAITSVAAGSTTTFGSSHACSPGASSDTAGKTWKTLVANTSTSTIPITNSGSAASISDAVESTWSVGLSRAHRHQHAEPDRQRQRDERRDQHQERRSCRSAPRAAG